MSHRVVIRLHSGWNPNSSLPKDFGFVRSLDYTYQATIIMLYLVHAPQQMRVPLIRVAQYETPARVM